MVVVSVAALVGRYPLEFAPDRVSLPATGPAWLRPAMLFGWVLMTLLGAAAQRRRRKD
jgi:LPXTG-motif cell wall-anchored protein